VETFQAFSALHFAVVVAIVMVTLAAIAVRRRRGGDASAVGPYERAIALGYAAMWAGTFVWLNTGPKHDPLTTWPLQLCHWVALADAIVLAAPWRPLRAVAYFCGVALCTQAVFTPSLVEGPAHWPFWFFWTTHAMIVAVPAYDIAARGFRPSWADWRVACLAAIGYVALILPVDLATGWNYGFVGPSKPDVPSIVDVLGPWPARLAIIIGIAFGAMSLLMLPWAAARRLFRRSREALPARR
jgi:hypothetical integral membrane protein (TIGR02206 family)